MGLEHKSDTHSKVIIIIIITQTAQTANYYRRFLQNCIESKKLHTPQYTIFIHIGISLSLSCEYIYFPIYMHSRIIINNRYQIHSLYKPPPAQNTHNTKTILIYGMCVQNMNCVYIRQADRQCGGKALFKYENDKHILQ